MVSARETGADSVMQIHHTCDTVESEPIELILLHVKSKIRKEESLDLMTTIIEQSTNHGGPHELVMGDRLLSVRLTYPRVHVVLYHLHGSTNGRSRRRS